MKKLLTILLMTSVVMGVALVASAQTCVFFSEYCEGSSYNKYVEIYNATGADLDLSTVQIRLHSNGTTGITSSQTLEGTLAPGGVFVVCHGSADPAILAAADMTSGTVNFNGDDAFSLTVDDVIVDVIGKIGEDPAAGEWGTGDASTKDNTIVRSSQVCCGDPDGLDDFDPAAEWIGYEINYFGNIGVHVADCGTVPGEDASWGALKTLYR